MPSQSRAATIPLIGGRPCLDLANTVSWRPVPDRREEHLLEPDDALTWCVRAGVLDQAEADQLEQTFTAHPHRGRALIDELVDLRQSVWQHVVDAAEPDVQALSPLVIAALTHCRLQAADDAAQWAAVILDEHTPARRVTLDLLDILTHPTGRIGQCSDATCGWAFVDTSRARNRRWCSSADCGNRHRARQHYARSR